MFNIDEFKTGLDHAYSTRDLHKVETYLKEAWENIERTSLTEKVENTYDIKLVVLNESLSFYRGIDKFAECISLSKEMRAIFRRQSREKSLDFASLLLNEGTTYFKMGDDEEALHIFKDCEVLLKELSAEKTYLMASLLNNRAPIFINTHEEERAIEDLLGAINILKVIGSKEQQQAISYASLAICYKNLQDDETGEIMADKAMNLYRQYGENAHIGVAYYTKAYFLFKRNLLEESRDYFYQAAELTKKYFGKNSEYNMCLKNAKLISKKLSKEDQ